MEVWGRHALTPHKSKYNFEDGLKTNENALNWMWRCLEVGSEFKVIFSYIENLKPDCAAETLLWKNKRQALETDQKFSVYCPGAHRGETQDKLLKHEKGGRLSPHTCSSPPASHLCFTETSSSLLTGLSFSVWVFTGGQKDHQCLPLPIEMSRRQVQGTLLRLPMLTWAGLTHAEVPH